MSRTSGRTALLGAAVFGAYAAVAFGSPRPREAWAVAEATSHAFSQPLPGLDSATTARHREGDRLFEASYVTAPAPVHAGLGPLFNQNGCAACHARDGRTPDVVLLRVSLPGTGPHGTPRPAPGLGLQIQDRAVVGAMPEARVETDWMSRSVVLSGGEVVVLRQPVYRITETSVPLPAGLLVSPRAPRPVFGLGLIEAVPDAALHALAAAQAHTGGVSGRVNTVWDPVEHRIRAGRFGHKATQASLLAQTATAFADDMGVTNDWFPGGPGRPDMSRADVEAVALYVRTLAAPARRSAGDPEVRRGEHLFGQIGCAACHVPRMETGLVSGIPDLSHRTFAPYSDLLLHDLGPALADGRPDVGAGGQEWKTAPLWGLGLSAVVNGQARYLHDGRAKTPVEAVLWHGGEAGRVRSRFQRLSPSDRSSLMAFLRSL